MTVVSSPLGLPAAAPELARRLGGIVAAVAALVARRFLREPKLVALILPLWGWLGRSARRFERVVTRKVVVRAAVVPASVAPVSIARAVIAQAGETRRPRGRLPSGQGWLVRALGYEAAGYGSQLAALLAEPEMQVLLAAVPGAGRVLRPLCRMLGVVPVGCALPVVVRAKRVRAPVVRKPRVAREKPWSPGRIRPFWVAKNEA